VGYDPMLDWDDGDRFSFDDSDRFEDSLCSWSSEPESLCNNWRGWKKPTTVANNGYGVPSKKTSDCKHLSLFSATRLATPVGCYTNDCFVLFAVEVRSLNRLFTSYSQLNRTCLTSFLRCLCFPSDISSQCRYCVPIFEQ